MYFYIDEYEFDLRYLTVALTGGAILYKLGIDQHCELRISDGTRITFTGSTAYVNPDAPEHKLTIDTTHLDWSALLAARGARYVRNDCRALQLSARPEWFEITAACREWCERRGAYDRFPIPNSQTITVESWGGCCIRPAIFDKPAYPPHCINRFTTYLIGERNEPTTQPKRRLDSNLHGQTVLSA